MSKTNMDEAVGGCVGGIAIAVIMLTLDVLIYFFGAFVMVKIWSWFVLPFLAVTPLPLAVAIGIFLAFALLGLGNSEAKLQKLIEENGYFVAGVAYGLGRIIGFSLILLMAWIVAFFRPVAPAPADRIKLWEPVPVHIEQPVEPVEPVEPVNVTM